MALAGAARRGYAGIGTATAIRLVDPTRFDSLGCSRLSRRSRGTRLRRRASVAAFAGHGICHWPDRLHGRDRLDVWNRLHRRDRVQPLRPKDCSKPERRCSQQKAANKVEHVILPVLASGIAACGTRARPDHLRKYHDPGALDRLYRKGMIDDPVGQAKSVMLTDEGLAESGRSSRKAKPVSCRSSVASGNVLRRLRHSRRPGAAIREESGCRAAGRRSIFGVQLRTNPLRSRLGFIGQRYASTRPARRSSTRSGERSGCAIASMGR